jgi:hypothetical protein
MEQYNKSINGSLPDINQVSLASERFLIMRC